MGVRARVGSPRASSRPVRRVRRAPRPRRARDLSRAVRHRAKLSASGLWLGATSYDPVRDGWRLRWGRVRSLRVPGIDAASSCSGAKPRASRALPSRGLDGLLGFGRADVRRAELRAAPAYFDVFSDGGYRWVRDFVSVRVWDFSHLQRHAATLADVLNLLPRTRCPEAWAMLGCQVWSPSGHWPWRPAGFVAMFWPNQAG